MSVLSGFFFNGTRSMKQTAYLEQVEGGFIQIIDEDGDPLTDAEDLAALEVSSRLGNTPRFIRFSDGEIFETRDNDAVDQLLRYHQPRNVWAYQLESKWRYALLGLLLTIATVWVSTQYGLPALAKYVAFEISVENNRRMGQGTMTMLDQIYDKSELPKEEQARLRKVFLDFIPTADGIPVQIEFRNMGFPNAFALPSGIVVFTDQLIELAEEDTELLGVYAHEVGHVENRHAMRGLLQQSVLLLVISSLTGDVSSIVAGAPALLLQMGYSRDFEREADRYAIQQLQDHQMDPRALATLLMRLNKKYRCEDDAPCDQEEESQWAAYLRTHPPTAERMKTAESAAQ